ncbi:MAG: kynureninase [Acidimicrobiales bacterium]
MTRYSRADAQAADAADPLAGRRDAFDLPAGLIYLDGNSLGPLVRSSAARVDAVLSDQWARGLVTSWNAAGWMDLPLAVGDRIAPLIGVGPGEVVATDTLTIVLAKAIGAALELRPERSTVLTDAANFHTDLYILEAVARRARRPLRVRAVDRADLLGALDDSIALVMLTHVDFRTGEMLDLPALTTRVHQAGALMLWDLAHSTGAVPVDLAGADADFAAGCTYKYLNGGPGSPAFLWVAPRLLSEAVNPLPGWLGHARPFAFEPAFAPAPGIRGFVTSTPSILALAALDGALDAFDGVDLATLRAKSLALTDLFITLVEERLPGALALVTPRDHARRGSQVAWRHPAAYGIVQALIARGVVGDFRAPDIARFGLAPLYVRFADVVDAVEHLAAVLETGEHLDARHATRQAVT